MGGGDGNAGTDRVVRLLLVVAPDPEEDPEQVERLTRRLAAEIAELDVDSVAPAAGGLPPPGAKGTDPVTVGALLVAFSASGGVFTALVGTLRDWLERQSARHRISMTIGEDTIELDRATAEERQRLVDAYVRRHGGEQAE